MERLKGKVILISGGARGQGASEARLFAAEGARVVIGDVLESEGRQLASELGSAAAFVRQDVTQESDWDAAVNAAEKLGGLHGMVNNAGIFQPRTLMETDAELFERHMRDEITAPCGVPTDVGDHSPSSDTGLSQFLQEPQHPWVGDPVLQATSSTTRG